MKKALLLISLFALTLNVIGQKIEADSSAYQIQRSKINGMLLQRKQKFGQYDESLSMHSGIFGMQTKKDIRNSNDILMDIVNTDDDIFHQLKILFDYKTFQQNKVQSHSVEIENDRQRYADSLSKLRQQTVRLKRQIDEDKIKFNKQLHFHLAIFVLMLASISFLLIKNRRPKV